MKNLPEYYWDTSIFLMVLNGETDHGFTVDGETISGQEVLDGAKDILKQVEAEEAVIISSQVMVVEVLPSKVTPQAYEKFEAWLQWRNLVVRAVDHPIAKKAAMIRDKCLCYPLPGGDKVKIRTVDPIHIATALIYGIEVIHAVDTDFMKALKYSGESIVPCRPRRIKNPQGELFVVED